jgi:hypothetical protein
METYKAFQMLNTVAQASRCLGKVAGALGKASGSSAALAVLGAAVPGWTSRWRRLPGRWRQYTKALLDMDGFGRGPRQAVLRSVDRAWPTTSTGFADAIKRLTDPSNVERLNDFGGACSTSPPSAAGHWKGNVTRDAVVNRVQAGSTTRWRFMVQNGNAELAASQFELMADKAKRERSQRR